MPFAARIICKRSFFAFLVALLAGCSAQHASLLPPANQTTTPARITSRTVRAGGKTYVIDELATPMSATLEAIAPGPTRTCGSSAAAWSESLPSPVT